MKKKVLNVLFVLMCFLTISNGTSQRIARNVFDSVEPNEIKDVSDFSVFYNINTNETVTKMMPRPWYKPGWFLRLPFVGGPCNCKELQCFCCTGLRVPPLHFDRRTCVELTYDPTDSLINMEVKMNNETILKKNHSARNAPSLCLPIIVPYLPPGLLDMCVRLFDISLVNQRLHVCLDIDTRLDQAPILILHFDCMDMGLDGVGLSKPSGAGGAVSVPNTSDGNEHPQADGDTYDLVTEAPAQTTIQTV